MSIKTSVLSHIKLDILQAPEGEDSRTCKSTVEDSDIEYVNQMPNPECVNQIPNPKYVNQIASLEYVNAWVDCS